MAPNSSHNMTSKAPALATFAEHDYLHISERIPALYVELHQQISAPNPDRLSWRQNFRAFTHIIAISMYTLNDSNMPAVNYCLNTLGPMADYHAIVTGLIRGLEARWRGEAEALDWDRVMANGMRLAAALDRVRGAWKKDLCAGAVAAAWRRG